MDAALVILDGWGLGSGADEWLLDGRERPEGGRDAVAAAETPNFDRYARAGAYGTLNASGRAVGLPDGQMGNSEVGHLNIGAGRVVLQAFTRIEDAIAEGRLGERDAIQTALTHAEDNDGRVHLMGLVSDGGVHSHQRHIHALLEVAAERGIPAVTHAFTDGRDTDPTAGAGYLAELQSVAEDVGTGDVATVSGRYYAMDRDQNWDRTKRAYDAIVERAAEHTAPDPVAAAEQSYDRDDTDEFVEPTLIEGGQALSDGDAVIFCNFRADRARQLCRMLTAFDPVWEFDLNQPAIELVTMTEYDREFPFPVAFEPNEPGETLGKVVADSGRTQLRIAESEKYAHVTYFLNGGREVEFDGEIRKIVESPDVPTYDHQPEMSAPEVTETAIDVVETDDPALVVLNYANPDMVGHTGDFDAAVAAVEAVDRGLGALVPAIREAGGDVILTADHGNADDMGTPDDPHTAHTLNPVPFVYLPAEGEVGEDPTPLAGRAVRSGGQLSDLAPTLLSLMDLDRPGEMTGTPLLTDEE